MYYELKRNGLFVQAYNRNGGLLYQRKFLTRYFAKKWVENRNVEFAILLYRAKEANRDKLIQECEK